MGITTKAVGWMRQKAADTISSGVDWYLRNGFYGIAGKLGRSTGYTARFLNDVEAMKVSVVFGAVKIISEDAGSLPLFLYRRTKTKGGESKEKATDNRLYQVLHDAPNEEMAAIDFRGALTAHAAVTGNGFAQILRRSTGSSQVIGMVALMPNEVTMDRDSAGNLVYIWKHGNSQAKTFGVRDIFHLRGFSWTGISGYSLVQQACNTLDLGMSAEEYAGKFFANDGTPSVVLKYPNRMSPEEVKNAKAAWMKAQSGREHYREPAVVHSGMELQPISTSPEETQLLGMRTFFIQEVCRFFRMPPHKLAELSHATFSNVENQERSYYTNCLRPWLERWEQAISQRCLSLADSMEYYAEHSAEGLLRGDFLSQTVGFARMLEKGVYSINEVRAMLNLNPVEGGEEHFIQLNMQSVSDAAAGLNLQPQGFPPSDGEPQQQQPPQKSSLWRVGTSTLIQ